MRRTAFVVALSLLVLPACGSFQMPPPVEPTPPPPSPVIHEPVCAPPGLVTGCWHQPPGEEWQFIPAPVTDATNCDGPVAGAAEGHVSTLGERVNQAILNVYGCDGGRCVVTGGRFLVQRKIIDELRRMGLCAGQHDPGTGPNNYGTDEIAVATSPTAVREGFRVYAGPAVGSGTLILSPQGQAPAWFPAGAAPPPPPPPPPTGSCPIAPCPDLVWTEATLPDGWSSDEIGRPRLQFNTSTYVGRWKDNTLVVVRNEPYCASIGMSPMADGQPRAACPLRPDGHTDREVLEAWASQGFRLESQNGATCVAHPSNPVMFEPNGGNCRLCTVRTFKEDKPLCGGWF